VGRRSEDGSKKLSASINLKRVGIEKYGNEEDPNSVISWVCGKKRGQEWKQRIPEGLDRMRTAVSYSDKEEVKSDENSLDPQCLLLLVLKKKKRDRQNPTGTRKSHLNSISSGGQVRCSSLYFKSD